MIVKLQMLLIVILIILYTLILAPIQLIAVLLRLGISKRIPILWHRLTLRLLGIRVKQKGELPTKGPLMLISNHISWSDIVVLGSTRELCFIAKQEVNDIPGANLLAKLQRTVFVKREKRSAVGKQVNEVTDRLLQGDVMVLFGEGTTSDGNYLMDFKSSLLGAAEHALKSGNFDEVLIQPVSISYTRLHGLPLGRAERTKTAWTGGMALGPHVAFIASKRAWDIEVSFGKPIVFTGHRKRREISNLAHAQVQEMFNYSIMHERGPL